MHYTQAYTYTLVQYIIIYNKKIIYINTHIHAYAYLSILFRLKN